MYVVVPKQFQPVKVKNKLVKSVPENNTKVLQKAPKARLVAQARAQNASKNVPKVLQKVLPKALPGCEHFQLCSFLVYALLHKSPNLFTCSLTVKFLKKDRAQIFSVDDSCGVFTCLNGGFKSRDLVGLAGSCLIYCIWNLVRLPRTMHLSTHKRSSEKTFSVKRDLNFKMSLISYGDLWHEKKAQSPLIWSTSY